MYRLFLILLFIPFLWVEKSYSQSGAYGGGADDKTLTFGFVINYYSSESIIYRKDGWQDPFFDDLRNNFATGTLKGIDSVPGGGIGFSGIINAAVSPGFFDIRSSPSVIFASYTLRYSYLDENEKSRKKDLQFVGFEIPIHGRLRSAKFGNFRANFLLGFKYSVNLNGDSKVDDSDLIPTERTVKYKTSFLSYEVGMGVEIYFEYFRMIPEIRLGYSLTNVLKHENTPFAEPIIQIIPKATTISIYFQ